MGVKKVATEFDLSAKRSQDIGIQKAILICKYQNNFQIQNEHPLYT